MATEIKQNENKPAIWQVQLKEAGSKMLSLPNSDKERVSKELGFAQQLFNSNPALQKCDPQSILDAIVNVSRLGITLNPAQQLAYLIPRKGKCVLNLSYVGMREILMQAGAVKNLKGVIVYRDELEDFEIVEGSHGYIKHKPKYDFTTKKAFQEREKVLVYTIATMADGSTNWEWMSYGEIMGIKDKASEGANSSYSPWAQKEFEGQMAIKTVLRRHFKSLPKTELSEAARLMYDIDFDAVQDEFEKKKEVTEDNIFNIEPEANGEATISNNTDTEEEGY